MKKNEPHKDRGLRLAMQRKNETAERMTLPEDFTDRLMQQIGELEQEQEQMQDQELEAEPKPQKRHTWLYAVMGAAAAIVVMPLFQHLYKHDESRTVQPVVAQQIEQSDSTVKVEENLPSQMAIQEQPAQMFEQEKPVIAKATEINRQAKASAAVHKTTTDLSNTDSLDYYIDKIERELAQVDESLYIEKMNKVIRADERLQRMVNSYILHTLDKEGRPQTADNMYNVKTDQDEE